MAIITTRTLLAGLAALAITGTAQASNITVNGPSHAATSTIRLSIADINLASEAGRDRLTNRINLASRRACGVGYGSALDNSRDAKSCVSNARADAWSQAESRHASGSRADLVVGVH